VYFEADDHRMRTRVNYGISQSFVRYMGKITRCGYFKDNLGPYEKTACFKNLNWIVQLMCFNDGQLLLILFIVQVTYCVNAGMFDVHICMHAAF